MQPFDAVRDAAHALTGAEGDYDPQTERASHYFEARLSEQFDAEPHFDETRALEPLERAALWETGEPPVTFPTGL
jgi:erythromycin esterase-like protein